LTNQLKTALTIHEIKKDLHDAEIKKLSRRQMSCGLAAEK